MDIRKMLIFETTYEPEVNDCSRWEMKADGCVDDAALFGAAEGAFQG